MKRPSHTQKPAFTLIELIAVIGIFAVLVALTLPTIRPAPTVMHTSQGNPIMPSDQREFPVATGDNPALVALRNGRTLLLFNRNTPDDAEVKGISGLQTNEMVVGMDTQINPVGGNKLFAITNHNRVLEINVEADPAVATFRNMLTQGFNDVDLKLIADVYHFYIDSQGLFENSFGRNEKWVRSDFAGGRPWFYILPNGELHQWDGAETFDANAEPLAHLGRNAYENPELLVGGSTVTPANQAELDAADAQRHFYRSSNGNFYYNISGSRERWIKGEVAKKSASGHNNPWYFILPTGEVKEWDGGDNLTGETVADITHDVAIYRDPSLLYDANLTANPVVAADAASLDQANQFYMYRFEGLVRNLYEYGRLNEDIKWFGGHHDLDYFIRPNGDVVRWDRMSAAGGTTIQNLGPHAWDNIEQVVNAYHAPTTETAQNYDLQRSFFRDSNDGNYYYNASGLREKWIKGNPLAKSVGRTNPWYFILPNGEVFEWDGGDQLSTSSRIGSQPMPQAYLEPNWLCDAYADGTVLNNRRPDAFPEANPRADGDRLNGKTLDLAFGIGSDFDPTTVPEVGAEFNTGQMLLATSDQQTLTITVGTGKTIINAGLLLNYRVGAAAYDSAGDSFVMYENGTMFDGFGKLNVATGEITDRGALRTDTNNEMALEIIGTGTPDDGETLAVLTVANLSGNLRSRLYSIDRGNALTRGTATEIDVISVGGVLYTDVHDLTCRP